jgi:hypothetical protein
MEPIRERINQLPEAKREAEFQSVVHLIAMKGLQVLLTQDGIMRRIMPAVPVTAPKAAEEDPFDFLDKS